MLVAALTCSAYAGEVPNGSPLTAYDDPTVIADSQNTGTSPAPGEANEPDLLTAEGAATELALDLLRSVLAFF